MRGDAGTRCRFSRKAPQKLSLHGGSPTNLFRNYAEIVGLPPCKEVFCQAFFQKSGNRVPRIPCVPSTNHNFLTQKRYLRPKYMKNFKKCKKTLEIFLKMVYNKMNLVCV